jgi:hypothetical protein
MSTGRRCRVSRRTSQNVCVAFGAPAEDLERVRAGIAIMSDSSIRSKPVIDQPSKPCWQR